MKRLSLFLIVLLLALPLAARAEGKADAAEPEGAPVKVQIVGLSKDRLGITYKITVLTHKPIRSIDLGVSSFSSERYVGATSLKWPQRGYGVLPWGRPVECTQRVLDKPLASNDTLTIERGVLQVTYTDGSTWTSVGKYGATGR